MFYRASQDGGQTWSAEVLISTYGGMNAPFHNDKGFVRKSKKKKKKKIVALLQLLINCFLFSFGLMVIMADL